MQLQKELFPVFSVSGGRGTPSDAGHSFLGLCNWRHPGATSALFLPAGHRSLQEELSPCLCRGMLSCPSRMWNHTGGPTCTAPGGCKTGGGQLSLQLTKFRRKRQLQVLKMPIRPPNKLSSVAGSSTTNYQYMGSCVGVDRDFKQPFEADILFQVEFVYLLFPQ